MDSLEHARVLLNQHFGFTNFREGQAEVVGAIIEGKDAIVVMPTGSGKSLCYQLPAMMREGATLVVSPLIALMKDQVDSLRAHDLPATFINSSLSESEQWQRIEAVRRGQFKIVYVAPERFRSGRFNAALRAIRVSLFAVDEAHCISTWGHDFRPDYLRLKTIRSTLGDVQTLALTATATPYVRSDIIQQLGLKQPRTFVSGFDRPNLAINVVQIQKQREKITRIKALANAHEGSGIVYTATRKAVEDVGADLHAEGLNVSTYHAGMRDAVRAKSQEDFMSGRTQIIVATNAFGMGIDKPDIRFVAHYQMPGSIEAYYQEIGRAGRDGLRSTCVLLFNYADKNTHDFFIEGSYPDATVIRDVYQALRETKLRQIELSSNEIAARSGVSNEMAVQSVLYLLERAGHIERNATLDRRVNGSARRSRTIIMLDNVAPHELRVKYQDVARRGELERRKLREMIEFCYSQTCFRSYILNYFGDRHHLRDCGSCGNCAPHAFRQKVSSISALSSSTLLPSEPRDLSADELLRVRKTLACAKRMRGRFGKNLLAGTLRGSAAQKLLQAHLNELSTYGILKDMKQDALLVLIDSLIEAGCLLVKGGAYPMVDITPFGERVMREQESVKLLLPNRL
ncbi:MAG: recombinase RecQ [Blastocatellia bacterium]|nr:MAG: recombinase RecQ [Blastocatellia bacterium]